MQLYLRDIGLRNVQQPGDSVISDFDRMEQRVFSPEEVGLFVNQAAQKTSSKFRAAVPANGKSYLLISINVKMCM